MTNEPLQHWGIPGMRWGVRRRSSSSGSNSTSNPKKGKSSSDEDKDSDDHTRVRNLKKKPMRKLSNQELQAVITRTQLERQYSEMNKTMLDRGKKIVVDTIAQKGQQEFQRIVTTQVDKGFRQLLSGGAAKNP